MGIWDLNFYRKHVYAGFVRGLGGELYTGIDAVQADQPVDTSKGIYSITGLRMPEGTTFSTLPSGVYVINGKKVVK